VESVITLLKSLISKAQQDGNEEEVSYMKFTTWCKNSVGTLESSITNLKDEIDALTDEVAAKDQEKKTLTKELQDLAAELTKHAQAGTKADNERSAQNTLYLEADGDYDTTIQAIESVITELESTKSSVSDLLAKKAVVTKLLQMPLVLEQLPESKKALLEEVSGRSVASAPSPTPLLTRGDFEEAKTVYKFKSTSVIDLLKELKLKFEDEKLLATREETNSLNAYQLAKVARDNAISAAQSSQTAKTTRLGEVDGELSAATSSLGQAKADLGVDEQTLTDTKSMCSVKATEWSERTELRQKEIEAMEASIAILAKVTGVRTEPPTNPVPPASPEDLSLRQGQARVMAGVALLQIVDPKMKAVNLLRERAQATHSQDLAKLAAQVEARLSGPFDDVNNMIQKMIFRLMSEQTDEDNHKNWCDLELQKTNASSTDKEGRLSTVKLEIEAAKARAVALGQEITDATDRVSLLETYMGELTDIRNAGKAENEAAISDAKAAQAALSEAMAVLEQYYRGMASSLLQQPVELPETPSTWEASYNGVADPNAPQPDGVISLLKSVSADFAQMEADTEAQEAMDEKAYRQELAASDIEKARRTEEAELKTEERKRLVEKTKELEDTEKHLKQQLDALAQYLKDLQPACVHGDSTYEARKASRAAEIDALKEAQVILQNAFKSAPVPAPAPAAFLQPIRKVGLAH